MNFLLLPDLAAMAMLLSILYFLRMRHPREAVDLWLVGLLFIFLQCCTWIPLCFFASAGYFRDAAYFLLFVLYFAAAVVFQISLPRQSLGKVAIVAGFVIWSFVFLFHSWASNHAGYDVLSDEIWNLQKFLVTIGMLLVLLEQQVATNEWYAFHDHLTGLPNQRLFEDRLAAAIQQSQVNNTRTALLMVHLAGF